MAENSPAPPPAKPRNPVEKLIVRGFILVMLILVIVEGLFKWQHHQVVAALTARMKAVDETPDSPAVTMADVRKAVGSKVPKTEPLDVFNKSIGGANHVDIYSWFTLNPVNKREMYVYYWKSTKKDRDHADDDDSRIEVLAVQVDDKAPAEPPKVAADQGAAGAEGGMRRPPMMPDGMTPPSAGRMGPGGGAGRPPAGNAETEKSDAEKTDADQPSEEKADDEKPADSQAGEDQ